MHSNLVHEDDAVTTSYIMHELHENALYNQDCYCILILKLH